MTNPTPPTGYTAGMDLTGYTATPMTDTHAPGWEVRLLDGSGLRATYQLWAPRDAEPRTRAHWSAGWWRRDDLDAADDDSGYLKGDSAPTVLGCFPSDVEATKAGTALMVAAVQHLNVVAYSPEPAPVTDAETETEPARPVPAHGLDLLGGALFELTAWQGLAMEKLAYLALAVHPNLPREQLAHACGRSVATVARYERDMTEWRMLDPDTRTVLYPRTGTSR